MSMYRHAWSVLRATLWTAVAVVCFPITPTRAAEPAAKPDNIPVVRSAQSGPWSAPATWENNTLPGHNVKVLIRPGHTVTYDVQSPESVVIRSIHIDGTLTFATDKSTQLNVGLIRIVANGSTEEEGFDCEAHIQEPDPRAAKPALIVGTAEQPVQANVKAVIRLTYLAGMNSESCPAIVCCAGRMDLHGAPLNRTWVKLGETAKVQATDVVLSEPVTGWRAGDKVILTATRLTHDNGGSDSDFSTEVRTITSIDGLKVTLDAPLQREHLGTGDYRGEIANLSRNVIVESSLTQPGVDPAKTPPEQVLRGHTMYHRGSAGSISYAEFRHLGKPGVLGRYSLHYHLVGNTMRGSSIVGASIWDSGNRWLTIHGTNYLVARDNVGFRSQGHGFFLEDGTEVLNILDRNLAVQAKLAKKLPKQVLPFDQNEGAGFWWANSLNTFTRNVSCENERYGYRFEATETSALTLDFPIQQPDGSMKVTDIRTLPFVRFSDNEAHCDGLYGMNIGEGVSRAGPDSHHPFHLRDTLIWEVHYAFRPQSPNLLVENLRIHRAIYGVYHPNYENHVYRNVLISQTDAEPFNRGHDDYSEQHGVLTVDGLIFDGVRSGSMPLIQISDDNTTGQAVSHFRGVQTVNWKDNTRQKAVVNLGGGPRPDPKTEKGVSVYLHDWFGPGRHAQVVGLRSPEYKSQPSKFRSEPPLTGDESRVQEVANIDFPQLLSPVDDLPPATVITDVSVRDGKLFVRGTCTDNGQVQKVTVNGRPARSIDQDFAQWEIILDLPATPSVTLTAQAEDAAGNTERLPHQLVWQAVESAVR